MNLTIIYLLSCLQPVYYVAALLLAYNFCGANMQISDENVGILLAFVYVTCWISHARRTHDLCF